VCSSDLIRMPYIVPRTTLYSQKLIINTADLAPEGNGLPFKLTLNRNELLTHTSNDFKNVKINVKIFDTKHDEMIFSKIISYDDLTKEISGNLNASDFKHGDQIPLEVKLTIAENPEKREIITDNGHFISFGYVASHDIIQGNIPKDKANEKTMNNATVKKPIQTIKVKDKDVEILYETLTASISSKIKTKTGYGIKPEITAKYQNDIHTNQTIPLVLEANKAMTSSEDHYGEILNDKLIIRLIDNKLPKVAIEQQTGRIRQIQFIDANKSIKENEIDGGNMLYVPIWHKTETETLYLKSINEQGDINTIGVNKMKLNMPTYIDIYAYMYNPSNSNTVGHDELLLKPTLNRKN